MSGAFARFVLVPILAVVLANLARGLSRRRSDASGGQTGRRRFHREDYAIGPDMIVLALASLLSLAVERAQALTRANAGAREILKRSDAPDISALGALQSQIDNAIRDFITFIVLAIVYTVLLFLVAAIVESFGRDEKGELRALGVVIPAVLGALSLYVVWRLAL